MLQDVLTFPVLRAECLEFAVERGLIQRFNSNIFF